MVREQAPCNSVNHQFRSRCRTPAKLLRLQYQFFVKCTSTDFRFHPSLSCGLERYRLHDYPIDKEVVGLLLVSGSVDVLVEEEAAVY
jgi:hypothetical protein